MSQNVGEASQFPHVSRTASLLCIQGCNKTFIYRGGVLSRVSSDLRTVLIETAAIQMI